MVSRWRLMFWRWAYRIHRQLHQVDKMASFYKVPQTTTSDAGANWEYDHSV